MTESSEYNSEAKGGQAATPGTDSNDDTPTYVTPDGEITESSVSDVDKKYSPNEEIIKTISNGGAINYDNSSIAVTATRWVVYDEDELKDSGQLKGTTFEKFKSAHSDPVQVDATQDEIDLIAKATGIQSSAIKLVCYERPVCGIPEEGIRTHRHFTDSACGADFCVAGVCCIPQYQKTESGRAGAGTVCRCPAGGYFR